MAQPQTQAVLESSPQNTVLVGQALHSCLQPLALRHDTFQLPCNSIGTNSTLGAGTGTGTGTGAGAGAGAGADVWFNKHLQLSSPREALGPEGHPIGRAKMRLLTN